MDSGSGRRGRHGIAESLGAEGALPVVLPRQTLGEAAYARIRDAVLTTAMRPGATVSEQELASVIGVSRTPVREAIRRLVEEGLAEVTAQQGTRVSRISIDRVRQAVFIRKTVEVAALRRVEAIAPASLARLKADIRTHKAAIAAGHPLRIYQEDERFHRDLLEAAGCPLASAALYVVSADMARIQFLMGVERDYFPSVVRDHQKLVTLLAERRVDEAADLLGRHIDGFVIDQQHLLEAHAEFFREG
jgi:DNA-binding GntR family transcriptional regulator